MVFDGRQSIIEIDDEEKTVYFDTWKLKKISGTKIGGLLGYSEFATEFKVACEIAGLYPGDKANKYIDAGNALEPVIRKYISQSATNLLSGPMGIPDGSRASVEEPVDKEKCQYDHFHNSDLFCGLVDGYIQIDGKRDSILEIKTSHEKEKWADGKGGYTNVPMTYRLQASLYAELSGLKRVVFVVAFLNDPEDYVRTDLWVPTQDNVLIIVEDKLEMSGYMADAEAWYKEYIMNGYTPEWTDRDEELLRYLRAGPKPKKGKR